MKNNTKKRLVIISGVTGAIGGALLTVFGHRKNTIVYGLSRKAEPVNLFLKNDKLPIATLACSIGDDMDFESLFQKIDVENVRDITYVHCVGLYPFEVDRNGSIVVSNDNDGDGVNDEVHKLTYLSFVNATSMLQKYWKGKLSCAIFAGLADKHHPSGHKSWWTTIEKVKNYMRRSVGTNENLSMIVFNISSVLCPHEVITRPFVFVHTDADPRFWLNPYELARFVVSKLTSVTGYHEFDKFKSKPGFDENSYYKDEVFTPRKVKELFN